VREKERPTERVGEGQEGGGDERDGKRER